MATYEEWYKQWEQSPYKNEWSQADLELAKLHPEFGMAGLGYKDAWHKATTPEQKALANAGMEQDRLYWGGYAGGKDGSEQQYSGTQIAQNAARDAYTGYGDFTWDREPDYQAALSRVTNPDPFSYDYKSDPNYQAYAKQYTREGRRASEDTMGQYAAMTGGRPSTAAVTASQQAGNYYASQLADKIPELYQQAYQRYLNEFSQRLQGLNALQQDYTRQYGAYNDKYNRLGDAYNVAAGENATSRAEVQNQEQTAYQRALAADETAYSREQEAWERQWKDAQLRAQYGDYSGLRALGIDVDAWIASQQKRTDGSSDSDEEDDGNRGGLYKLPSTDSPNYLGAIQNALQTGYNRDSTIENLAKQGVSADDILQSRQTAMEDTNRGGYVPTAAETLAQEVSAINTQKDAVNWLTSKGLSSRDWQIPSEAAFDRGKNDPESDYYGYATYAEFLRDYAKYIYSEFGGK